MRYLFFLFLLISFNASAQDVSLGNIELGNIFDMLPQDAESEGVKSFANPSKWKKEKEEVIEEPILPEISVAVSSVAIKNIINAEEVFCYNVEKKPNDYEGYTISGFAVNGFCGIINKTLQKRISNEFLRTQSNIVFDKSEKCTIQPKVMLRFFRGVDHTDVLVSSPCFSFSIFYVNKINTFNARPMQGFIKSLIEAFNEAKVDFVSPALYGQLVPNGQEPEKKVKQKPVEIKELPKVRGWNNISF